MSTEPVIKVRNVNHYYGKGALRKQILFDISLDIHPGEIVIMSGPSGSGKTTLLSLIGGLRSVHEGSLQILSNELNGASSRLLENVRKQIGFIFQAHNLLTSLTTSQNVQMSLVLNDEIAMEDAQQRSQAALSSVGLGQHIHAYPHQLSGGQKQRVAIARALVNHPPLILADEPTAALDKVSGRDVVELMQKLARQQGCTILLVTHDNRILDIADRIISLEDGRLASTKAQMVLEMQSTLSTLLQRDEEELNRHVDQLSMAEFINLLQNLQGESEQLLQTVDILSQYALEKKLEEMISALTLKVSQLLQADRAVIFLVDRVKQRLWSRVTRYETKEVLEISQPLETGISGYVVATGQSLNIPDAYSDSRFNPDIDRATGYQTRNLLCLPIVDRKNQVFAVALLVNKLGDQPFNSEDESRFREFTQSLSIILETSFSLLQQYRERVAL
jgi:putative ABC transport system ATP-binding protein